MGSSNPGFKLLRFAFSIAVSPFSIGAVLEVGQLRSRQHPPHCMWAASICRLVKSTSLQRNRKRERERGIEVGIGLPKAPKRKCQHLNLNRKVLFREIQPFSLQDQSSKSIEHPIQVPANRASNSWLWIKALVPGWYFKIA